MCVEHRSTSKLSTSERARSSVAASGPRRRPFVGGPGGLAGKEVHVAVEACTGWLFVCEALVEAGAIPHLAEPVETSALRGRKRRAKTDREDARWLRTLLCDGRLPEAWIPPAHVREWRTRARLRKTLVDERTRWLVRVQATLFHDGVGGCAGQAARAPRAARSSPGSSCPRRPGSGSGWRFR